MRGALESISPELKVLILSDFQAAIAVAKKAGKTGRARTCDLHRVMNEITKRQENLGPNAVWVKAHIGLAGNEMADQLVKEGTEIKRNPTNHGSGTEAGVETEARGGEEGDRSGDVVWLWRRAE